MPIRKSHGAAIQMTVGLKLMLRCVWYSAVMPLFSPNAIAQLNQNCVVSVLNRTVQVNTDGTWVLPNIPANFGNVRARATCVNNGITTFGQSAFFSIAANGSTNVPPIVLGPVTPVPTSLAITSPINPLTVAGSTAQLSVMASYATGPSQDVTAASTGTTYTISNPAIATISPDGLMTAVSSGTAVIQAVNEGRQGITNAQVVLAGASHGGIPDSWAILHGLDPNDPAMPFEDPDHDGLTNLQEFQNGTDPQNPDTDGDGLTDGQEVLMYHTNPVLFSTDATGISDGIEVQTGTLNSSLSAKLAAAIKTFQVSPSNFVLDVNTIQGLAAQQLTVTALLIDGKTTLDLTSTLTGTNYSSSDLTICNFGVADGNVFAGNNGSCQITVTNSGFTAHANGTVSTFTPTSLSFVAIPGFANEVAVNGNYAYVAAGASGLQVVDVSSRTSPRVVASMALQGNSNDVKLLGNYAYIAGGSAGLQVVDISNPTSPILRGTFSLASSAVNVVVRGTKAYIANGSRLLIADVTNPASMSLIGSLTLPSTLFGMDVDTKRNLAVVASGTSGIRLVDVSNPSAPKLLDSVFTGDARAVAIKGNYTFVADYDNSTTSVDITTPSTPIVVSHIADPNLGGFLQDIVLSANFALAADVKFVNGVPITDITAPTNLISRAILNFPQRDDNGMGIAVDGTYAYVATERNSQNKYGTTGDSRLYIGQYLALVDNKGIPPTVAITSPVAGSMVIEGQTVSIIVNATDDVAVAAVNFLVNGEVVFTATSAPYQYNFTIPAGVTSLTLGANAVDLGGNVGTAQKLTLNVIPDPGTNVTGQVLDRNGNPISGATVSVFGSFTSNSTSDGSFSIVGVPTVIGNIVATASAVIGGTTYSGVSTSVSPVAGGVTNVGTFLLGVLKNGSFGTGNLDGWSIGPGSVARVISSLGPAGQFTPIKPEIGQFMAFLSNSGSASTPPGTTGSTMSQAFVAPLIPAQLSFCYQFISNDSLAFPDFFLGQLLTSAGTFTLASADNAAGSPAGGNVAAPPPTVSTGVNLIPNLAPVFPSGVNILGSTLKVSSSLMTVPVCASFAIPVGIRGTQVTLQFTAGNAVNRSIESAVVISGVSVN